MGSTTTEYFTSGSTILAEKTGLDVIWYIYDSDGEILGFTYNGTPYYYIKNQQGDVCKVVTASGSVVASYTYDAWGKVTSASGSMANVNPIRYRSYYYDTETNLYYWQSRYYDAETGRFVNADTPAFLGVNGAQQGYNLFAYCNNNPIIHFDNNGYFLCTFIGSLVGGACGMLSAIIEGKTGTEMWASAANGAIAGAVSGLAADIIIVTGGSAAVVIGTYVAAGALGSMSGSLMESAINGENMSSKKVWSNAGIAAAEGAVWGAVAGAMEGPATSMMKAITQSAGKKAVQKGITVTKAIVKTIKREVRHIRSSVVEELISNTTASFSS